MNLFKATNENIITASEAIKSGELVAFPTETVYGLGADGLNPIAVAKIFEAKNRPSFNPLILHIADKSDVEKIAKIENPKVVKLIEKFWPGPLTLVLPKTEIVPTIVTAGNDTVGIRMPDHPVALELIKNSQTPIAAPSANTFGQLSPTTALHVKKQLGDKVNTILDGGKCAVGVESTILQVTKDEIILLRPGGLALEDIEAVVGKVITDRKFDHMPISPGQLPFHYATTLPLHFMNEVSINGATGKRVGVLFLKENKSDTKFDVEKILSPSGNLIEAAANLFSHLHELESADLDLILVEPIEETGLGKAIMDRLRKASNKYA